MPHPGPLPKKLTSISTQSYHNLVRCPKWLHVFFKGSSRKSTSKKEPYTIELFKCFAQRVIKKTLHHKIGLMWAEIPLICKELPNDVGSVSPPVLSEWTAAEHVCNRFHQSGTTMGTTFVNLHWDFSTPFINRDRLMDDDQRKTAFFCALVLC